MDSILFDSAIILRICKLVKRLWILMRFKWLNEKGVIHIKTSRGKHLTSTLSFSIPKWNMPNEELERALEITIQQPKSFRINQS
jgi:hypothetical protein